MQELLIHEEKPLYVGQDTFIDSTGENNNCVAFEDDGDTGYFYALDREHNLEVLDALHVYNVTDVINKDKPSVLRIIWTSDFNICFLSINGYYHAVFDFKNKAGYCRNAFPNGNESWTLIKERKLTDELINVLISKPKL
jgi:hypothetical protein